MSGIVGSKFNHRGSGLVGSLGTDGQHLLSSGAGKKHVFETVADVTYDDEPIKSDLTALAIREATNEASAAFNLPGSFIETFTDDTNLGTETDGDRVSGYWASATYANVTTTPGDGDWDGGTGSFSFGSGTVDVSSGNDAVYLDTTFTGDVTVQFTAANKDGAGWGFYEAAEDAAFEEYWRGGMNDMTNSWWWHHGTSAVTGGSNADSSFYGDSVKTDHSNLPASGSVVQLKRVSGVITLVDDDSTIDTWSQTSTNPLRFVFCSDYRTDGDWDAVTYTQPVATLNATGTLIQSANSVTGARTEVGGTMLYSDEDGTATLGTDLKIYFTCDGGSNWTEAASYNAITPVYSSGIKQVRLGETTCTGGTDVRYKAVFANQSDGSKETRLHAIGTNY